jgi:HlyD family secretion protein
MKVSRTQWVLVALIAVGGAAGLLLTGRGKPVEVVVVTQGPMVQSVVTSGRIASVGRTELASQNTARIEAILVREGDAVQARQVLVRLHDDEAAANLAQAKAAVTEARGRIRQLNSVQVPVSAQQLAQARAADTQAQNELARVRQLVQQGFVSPSRLDDAMRAATASASAVLAASAQAAGTGSGGAEAELAQSRLAQALAAERAALGRLDQLSLRAPVAGTVISRAADPGDTAQPGLTLLTLVSGDETRIQASVDEKNLSYLKLGQTARATADAYPERPFNATLTFIAPAVDAQRGTVDLKLRVDSGVEYLRPDMTVSVEIITAQAANALKLPTDAVRRDANGGAYALVNRGGRAEKVQLVLGLRGIGTTQVLEGLAASDRVITLTTSPEEGDRVREQAERVPKGNAQPVPGLTQ